MKYVLALLESTFSVIAVYVVSGLTLFALGTSTTVPGIMTATTVVATGRATTHLEFHAVGGVVLLATLFGLFLALHRLGDRRAASLAPTRTGARVSAPSGF